MSRREAQVWRAVIGVLWFAMFIASYWMDGWPLVAAFVLFCLAAVTCWQLTAWIREPAPAKNEGEQP